MSEVKGAIRHDKAQAVDLIDICCGDATTLILLNQRDVGIREGARGYT